MMVRAVRVTVTLPKTQVAGIDTLVAAGHYMDRGDLIRDALRLFFARRGQP